MAEPLNLTSLIGLTDPNTCTLEASCVTGFESTAAEEVEEVLGVTPVNPSRGRVVFDIPLNRVREVLELRCVNTVWVLLGHKHSHDYPEDKVEQMDSLAEFMEQKLDWEKGLGVWREVMDFKGELHPSELVEYVKSDCKAEETEPKVARLSTDQVVRFRSTCYRSGTGHKFKSTEVQAHVGGRVQDKFLWPVDCKNYDLEFVINCDQEQVYCGLTLTNRSLGERTVSVFGPCTLRPPIAACLARLANIQPGEVVLDPMCGGGSIPLEASLAFPFAFHLGAELHGQAVARCRQNLDLVSSKHGLATKPPMDVVQWNCLNPPFRDNSVDVVISDLPFGKRSGSKLDNRVLYPSTLIAMARIVRPDTGRAVLLTQDKTSMFKSFNKASRYWKLGRHFACNIGGLTALVFHLSRTNESP